MTAAGISIHHLFSPASAIVGVAGCFVGDKPVADVIVDVVLLAKTISVGVGVAVVTGGEQQVVALGLALHASLNSGIAQ